MGEQFEGYQDSDVHVGENIRDIRREKKWSQSQFAQMLEDATGAPVSQQYVSDLEHKAEIEDQKLLQQIADLFEVSPDFLRENNYDKAVKIYNNTFNDHSIGNVSNLKMTGSDDLMKLYKSLSEKLDLLTKENKELKEKLEGKK
jgi:transcriptional regulator with XRE-family HTH domain